MIKLKKTKYFHYLTGCKLYFSMSKSPMNICLIQMMLLSIMKIIWIMTDPFTMENIMPRHYERILGEITYSVLFAIYGVILLAWYSIYDEVSSMFFRKKRICCKIKKCSWKIFRLVLKFFVFYFY